MSIVDRIVEHERQKRNRQDSAFAAVRSLPVDERRAVLARLIEAEDQPDPELAVEPEPSSAHRTPPPSGTTFVDKAEAFVLAHPEGVKARAVGESIGQKRDSATGSLNQAAKRGSIVNRHGTWFPVDGSRDPRGPSTKKTIRQVIIEAFAAEKKPMGAKSLYEACSKIKKDIHVASVHGEINRMKHDRLLIKAGRGARGSLFSLAPSGSERPSDEP